MSKVWTHESVKEIALQFNSRYEFAKNSYAAYGWARRHKILDSVCLHMLPLRSIITKERCINAAKSCSSRTEFWKKFSSLAKFASEQGLLDEICASMALRGNKYKRLIYAYEFSDNTVYVGLTHNSAERHLSHMNIKNSPVYRHSKKTNSVPLHKFLTNYLPVDDAIIKEAEFVEEYRNKGWQILNKSKTGALGSPDRKWTIDKIKEVALKCNTRSEFFSKYVSAYNRARLEGVLDEVCAHMSPSRTGKFWTYGRCHEETLKYSSRSEFQNNASSAYNSAFKNKWLDEICSHMIFKHRPDNFWNFDKCIQVAQEFKSITELSKKFPGAYTAIRRNKWQDSISSLMGWR